MTKILMVKTPREIMKERRFRTLRFSPQAFIQMFSSTQAIKFTTDRDIPDDSAVVSVYYDPVADYFLLRVMSETFEPVLEGEVVPAMSACIEMVTCKCNS